MTIDHHENLVNNHPHPHRMVVLLGPHKSASSSVQELFMEHASGGPQGDRLHHPSLANWTWPYHVRRRSYLPRKGFAPLVTEGVGFHELIWDTMRQVWNGSTTAINTTTTDLPPKSPQHMIWGTEELDRFGPTPWSHRNGIQAIQKVVERMPPTRLDLVVNYRRPRQDQWLSIWKQLYRKTETPNENNNNNNNNHQGDDVSSYATFLCDPNEQVRIWEYLDCVATPLGLVAALLEAFSADSSFSSSSSTTSTRTTRTTVHLLDMQGIAALHRDVGHVVACDILQVPCTDHHWLPQIDHPIVQNSRSRPSGLTMDQLDDMEWILRYRDCSYRRQLLSPPPPPLLVAQPPGSTPNASASSLFLHYAETLWEGCEEVDDDDDDDDSMYRYGRNTTWLLEYLQSQVGCGPLPATAIGEWRRRTVLRRRKTTNERPVVAARSPAIAGRHPLDDAHVWKQTTTATRLGGILYLLLLASFGISMVRRLKCGRGAGRAAGAGSLAVPPPPRRSAGRRQG